MKNILEADSIHLSFAGRMILNNIYLSCQTGEVVGLLGRNGSGKSCLMKIIFGTMKADNQSVRINRTYYARPYRQPDTIRYLPQDGFLPGYLTVQEAFQLFSCAEEAFDSFDELAGIQSVCMAELSGGMKKLVEVLTILYSQADFVLLDEPFSFLAPLTIEKIRKLIDQQRRHKGIMLTDHMYRTVLETCDRLYLVHSGVLHPVNDSQQLEDLGYTRNVPG